MPTEDEMTVDERQKYPRKMKKRYEKADRQEKGRLLDEMAVVTGPHRKSLTRLMDSDLERKARCKQRDETYGPERNIPMVRIPWDEREPGHLETDLVHHCGATASGE